MCVNENIAGVCQPDGNCSFPDPACDSGFRYGDDADAALAGTCVPAEGTSSSSETSMPNTTPGSTSTTGETSGTASTSEDEGSSGSSSTGVEESSSSGSTTGPMGEPNVVFVTSESMPVGSIGGLAGADEICAQRANDANLPGTYVAWLSDSKTDAVERLAGARGWVRTDGLVFADRVEDIVEGNIYNPIYLDETGTPVGSNVVTGTVAGGTASADTCADWTSSNGDEMFHRGVSHHVHPSWTSRQGIPCSQNARLYCFGIDRNATVPPPAQQRGRVAFTTAQELASDGGLEAFDAACAEEATVAGLSGTFSAAVATSTASALSRFDLDGEPWVNTLGQVVIADPKTLGSGSFELSAAIAWDAQGSPVVERVWTGADGPNDLGVQTCGDWSDIDGATVVGAPTSVLEWFSNVDDLCSREFGVYCLEE